MAFFSELTGAATPEAMISVLTKYEVPTELLLRIEEVSDVGYKIQSLHWKKLIIVEMVFCSEWYREREDK